MWGEDRGPTIPQPFHFATMDRGGGGSAAGEAAASAAGEAPALSQRALLRMILEDGGESEEGRGGGVPGAASASAAAAAPASSPHNVTVGLGAGEGGVDITRM